MSFFSLALLWVGWAQAFSLSSKCPPGFVLNHRLCHLPSDVIRRLEKNPVLHFSAEPLDPQVIELGKLLFFDPLLSGNHDRSCASCHQPDRAWSDGRAVAQGTEGPLTRATPSLWNVGFYQNYFWDGRARTLESQAEGPLFHPNEMGNTPRKLLNDLNRTVAYRSLFTEAFGKSRPITLPLVLRALATFEKSLVSLNSRYDRYVDGETAALNADEEKGLAVFRSFVTRCTECHEPPLFTNFQFASIGAPELSGLSPDPGIEKLLPPSVKRGNRGAFRVPPLRNVARTAPYMHSGGISSLGEVIQFYNEGGGRKTSSPRTVIHWHIRPFGLSEVEQRQLLSFLDTLTDESQMPEIPKAVPSGLSVDVGGPT